MPRKVKKTAEKLVEDRLERMKELKKLIDESGKGLMKSQVELKLAPWHVTWERQDMLMERQEKIIGLLEDILKEMKKKK